MNKTLMKIAAAAASFLMLSPAIASEAVPGSIIQDEIERGCQVHSANTFAAGPNLYNFGAACGFWRVTATASADYQGGFGAVSAGFNTRVLGSKPGDLTVIASVNAIFPHGFGNAFNSTGTFDIQPALTMYDDDWLADWAGAGAQVSGRIALNKNALQFAFPDEYKVKGWLVVHPDGDADKDFDLYAIAEWGIYGTPSLAACANCLNKLFESSSNIRAGGGFNWYLGKVRLFTEATFSVDGGPLGQNGLAVLAGARFKL